LSWKLPETIPQRLDHIVRQCIAFDALDSLTESLRRVVEVVKYDLLQSEPAQLCYGVELRRVKRDVSDQRQRRVALQDASDRPHVHDPVRCRVEDYDTNGLTADQRFELLP
jgi:hypothetical protein